MKLKSKTLAIVLPPGGNTDEPGWGRIEAEVTPRLFLVQVPKTKTPKGFNLPELIPVRAKFLVPLPRAGKSSKKESLRKSVFRYVNRQFPKIAKDFSVRGKLPKEPTPLAPGTLVVVIKGRGFLRKPCWGIISKMMPSYGFDVALSGGPKIFGLSRASVFAKQDELVPVARTDGNTTFIQKLIFKNMDKVIPFLVRCLINEETRDQPST